MALEDFESKLNFLFIKCKTNAPLYFKMHRFCTALVLYQNLSGLPEKSTCKKQVLFSTKSVLRRNKSTVWMKAATQIKSPAADIKTDLISFERSEDIIQTCLDFIVREANDFIK